MGLPECFGLKNHVEVETHIKGNTLDLVITRENELLPTDITTDTSVTSDHVAVLFGIPAPKPLSENKYRLKRKEKNKSREEIFYQMKVFFLVRSVAIFCKSARCP